MYRGRKSRKSSKVKRKSSKLRKRQTRKRGKRMIQRGGVNPDLTHDEGVRGYYYYKNTKALGEWRTRQPDQHALGMGASSIGVKPNEFVEINAGNLGSGSGGLQKLLADIQVFREDKGDGRGRQGGDGAVPDHNYGDPGHPNWAHVRAEGNNLFMYKGGNKLGQIMQAILILQDI